MRVEVPPIARLSLVAWATALLMAVFFWNLGGRHDGGARTVPERQIPVPGDVSPKLQGLIAQSIDGPYGLSQTTPTSRTEWATLIARVNQDSDGWRSAALRAFPATISEEMRGGVHVYIITPSSLSHENRNRLLIHFHGGAYVFFGGRYAVTEGVILAHFARTVVESVDYRMPPDHPFPAAVDDGVAVWQEAIKSRRPENVGIFGASAGGGLTLATVMRLRQLRLSLPGAIAPGTPWADLTKTGDTYFTNTVVDGVAIRYEGLLESCALLYAGGRNLKDPLLSPVYGSYDGFPPAILTSGTRDLFLSNTVRVYRKLRNAGVDARLDVYEALAHGQYLASVTSPETKEAMTEVASFFDQHLGR